jgi:hypothetical protein
MSNQPFPTVSSRMQQRFVPYILALTVLWLAILRITDFLPKEGELIPRGGTCREATQADRILSLIWYTACWYGGALIAFGLVWRVAQITYDVAFGSERSE